MTTSQQHQDIVRALVALAASLGIELLAEGVEPAEHYELLVSLGISKM